MSRLCAVPSSSAVAISRPSASACRAVGSAVPAKRTFANGAAFQQARRVSAAPSRIREQRFVCRVGPVPGTGLNPELKQAIDNFIASHKVVAFIKGTRDFPQCGFSNTVVQILNTTKVPYETVNILEDDRLRSGMKEYSQWPTFPQIYIGGEFFGGCDIMIQAYQSGELKETMERIMVE